MAKNGRKIFDFGRNLKDYPYTDFTLRSFEEAFGSVDFSAAGPSDFLGVRVAVHGEGTHGHWTCHNCGHIEPDFGDKMLRCSKCLTEVINVEAEDATKALGSP